MTVVAEGEPEVLEQIEKQLAKLVDVSKIQMLPADASVCRELILIKGSSKTGGKSAGNCDCRYLPCKDRRCRRRIYDG